jgi:hypothetical protein
MGNIFSKKNNSNNSNNSILENLIQDLDYNNNNELFEQVNIDTKHNLEDFNNSIIKVINRLQLKINNLENALEEKNNESNNIVQNQNSIYTINEQINLIHKDLKALMENDKILIEKYNISRNPQLLNEQSSQLEFNNMTTKNTKNTSNIIDNDITY